jgi:prolyl oligopeptidase
MRVVSPAGPMRPRPTIVTGYGGFGVCVPPGYHPELLTWLTAGGAVAIPAVRGGGEEGGEWHRAGSGGQQQNSFDDFHAAAEWLLGEGRTGPGQLGTLGASNGGLLVAGAAVQRPELYQAVVADAPLLDMVRYELSGLGPLWVAEYGTASDPEQLGWLLGYSPYHNVRPATAYPATLLVVFDGDTRVDPLHARKHCAALQHAQAGPGPILLRVVANAGHGPRPRSLSIAVAAESLAFLAAHTGLSLELTRGQQAVGPHDGMRQSRGKLT